MVERLLLAIAVTFSVHLSVNGGFDKTPLPPVLQFPTLAEHNLIPWQ